MRNVVAAGVVLGVFAGLFNIARLAILALYADRWNEGSYQQPVFTAIQVYAVLVCGVLAVLAVVGILRGGSDTPLRVKLIGTAFLVALTLASGGLFFVHLDEVNVSTAGFAQSHYVVNQHGSLRFYNPSDAAVTVCVGQRAVCTTSEGSPDRLQAPGLTLRPDETLLIDFDNAAELSLTVTNPAAQSRFPDASVVVRAVVDVDSGPF
jgi:hypothetical protein